MKLTKGTILKARGGWDAEVIWVVEFPDIIHGPGSVSIYAIHKPGDFDESVPIGHWVDGTARSTLSVNEPPSYNGHPSDLEMGEYEL